MTNGIPGTPDKSIPGSYIVLKTELPEVDATERSFMHDCGECDSDSCSQLDSQGAWFCERIKGHKGPHAAWWSRESFITWGWPEEEKVECLLSVEVAP